MICALLAVKALENEVVTADVQLLAWALGFLVPVLTAIVTKKLASSVLKAMTNAALSAVGGLLAVAIAANGTIEPKAWAIGIGNAAAMSWASYYGFWKPTKIAPKVQAKTARFGIGTNCQ